MIQRIQSLYLALASLAAIFILIPFEKLPLVKFYGDTVTIHFHGLFIKNLVPGESDPFNTYFLWPFVFVVLIIFIISVSSIFLYKNHKNQLFLIKVSIFFTLVLLAGFFFYYVPTMEKVLATLAIYQLISLLPALILFFLILAYRGVKKDDNLIKSMDRIR